MKVAIDGSFSKPNSGTYRYVVELAKAFQNSLGDDDVILLTSPANDARLREDVGHVTKLKIVEKSTSGKLGHQLRATRAWVRRESVDVLHSPGYFAPRRSPCAVVVTVHDVNFLVRIADWARSGNLLQSARLSAHLGGLRRVADAVVVPSFRTRRDLLRFVPSLARRTHVIRYAANSQQLPNKPFSERSPTLLSVGVIAPQKNLESSIRAFGDVLAQLPKEARYRIVGGDADGYWTRVLQPLVASLGLSSSVEYVGSLSDDELAIEYQTARGLAFVSRGEGFGLPALESISNGLPVIGSSTTAIAEATSGCALIVDPDDVPGIGNAIRLLLDNEDFWMLQKAQITWHQSYPRGWDDVAKDHLEVYRFALLGRQGVNMTHEVQSNTKSPD